MSANAARLRHRSPVHALFWRMFVVNVVIVGLALAFLAFSPTTVSTPVLAREMMVLALLLVVVIVANALVSNRLLARLENEHLRMSSNALAAQERERQRIAQELHDEIGQTLTVSLLNLKPAIERVDADVRPSLLATQESIRGAIEEVRQIARRLRPDVLSELGLMSALSALITEFSQASGLPVERRFAHPMPELNPDQELVCYRIVQECLTNIVRHSKAGKVSVGFTEDRVLTVADDGKGGISRAGAGIRGMRERALLVGADLSIESPAGVGTTVSLRIPS